MSRLAVAVVGLGVISRFYLAALDGSATARLAAVCDRDGEALGPWRGRVPAFSDHRELLAAGPSLDGVVVTVPNDAHARVCAGFLRAGVPVCVEKPLALTTAQAAELTALASESEVPLFTAFHRRYNLAALALAERLRQETAPVEHVRVRYFERIEEHVGRDRWYLDPSRCGGGCLADNGPNAFDLVRLLLGEAELAVETARIHHNRDGIDRQAVVGLRAVSGSVRATVELDWSYPGELKDIEVTTADGTVHRADLLAGHQGFKASLRHEYVGVLADFTARLGEPLRADRGGVAALELVEAGYRLAAASSGTPAPTPASAPAPASASAAVAG